MWFKRTAVVFFCLSIILGNISNVNCDVIHTLEVNGKVYQIVEQKLSWTDASKYASEKNGYLVHINDQEEQDLIYSFITDKIPSSYTTIMDGGGVGYVWIGANDLQEEGTWVWDGANSGTGTNFWKGQGTAGAGGGSPVEDLFHNWGGKSQYGTPKEPDNFGGNQHAAAIALEPWPKNNGSLGKAGEWNDINVSNTLYFIIEIDETSKINNDAMNVNSIKIYPNPAMNIVYISYNHSFFSTISENDISLFNSLGDEINIAQLSHHIDGYNVNYTFDISHLPSGVYMLKVNNRFINFIKL